ncbi:hypothetical protein AB1Y20_003385 [Prymnesium parvum]|uniref:VHS domain-containing protein n=1 Tax=Prymnesium parvum TaxID=97485 RepID=A0AB34JAR4_PRYPA
MSFFDRLFDTTPAQQLVLRATDELLLSLDWGVALDLAELIQAEPSAAKDALKCMKKRFTHKEPKVHLFAVTLLDFLLKNCAAPVLAAAESKEFLSALVHLATSSKEADGELRLQIEAIVREAAESRGGEFALARAQLEEGSAAAGGGGAPLGGGILPVADDPIPTCSSTRGPVCVGAGGSAASQPRAPPRAPPRAEASARGAGASAEAEAEAEAEIALAASLGDAAAPAAAAAPHDDGSFLTPRSASLREDVATLHSNATLFRECVGSAAAEAELLLELRPSLEAALPRLVALVEGGGVEDEALLSQLLATHDLLSTALASHAAAAAQPDLHLLDGADEPPAAPPPLAQPPFASSLLAPLAAPPAASPPTPHELEALLGPLQLQPDSAMGAPPGSYSTPPAHPHPYPPPQPLFDPFPAARPAEFVTPQAPRLAAQFATPEHRSPAPPVGAPPPPAALNSHAAAASQPAAAASFQSPPSVIDL